MSPSKILLIDWIDSVTDPGWKCIEDCIAKFAICRTVGFFVTETKDVLCVAQSRTVGEEFRPYGELINIPKVSIRRRKEVK